MAHPFRAPAGLAPLEPADPRSVPPFTVHGRLGAGGMGVVLAATDPAGAWVAIKVVRPEYAGDAEFRARFAGEVELMRRVRARCIAPVLAHDTRAGQPWYATPYLPGPTLGARVRQGGAIPMPQARVVAAGMAEAIAAIHAAGVLHRDLKPSNVILAPDGPKVLDFGIARAVDETGLTRTGGLVGSPGWLSPERYRGVSGPEADVFAWGAMVAFAATGRSPFGGGGAETLMYRILNEEPDLGGLPEELREPVTAALDKDPDRRPRAAELLHRIAGPAPGAEAGADAGADDTTVVDGLIRAHWDGGGDGPGAAAPPETRGTRPAPPEPHAARPAPPAVPGTPPPAPAPPGTPGDGPPARRWKLPLALTAGALSVALIGVSGLIAAARFGGGDDGEPGGPGPAAEPPPLAGEGTLSGAFQGAGSTFLAAAFEGWAADYAERQPGVEASYDAVGSGAGAQMFVSGEADFGSAEAGLTAEEVEAAEAARGCPVVQFPVVTGAVAVVSANEELEGTAFTADGLASLYRGEDLDYPGLPGTVPAEGADGEGPSLEIVPVRHDDTASTARVFADYLASRGTGWDPEDWGDAAVAAPGDEGVYQVLQEEQGGIGFVNASFADEMELTALPVVNDSGSPVVPDPGSTEAATEQLELDGGRAALPSAEGEAYPIMRIAHVFAFECGYDGGAGAALRDFWLYALGEEGAGTAQDTGYTPLGPVIAEETTGTAARIGTA
ncbi:serine/threonine-protein kinase [Nocardiopsis potens]|uniref:serine/threonine-protein kinase n=1 Tax=Nocardiopsis potens TaxID=1246458 RepID=UPI00034745E7|nr:serine/threonine-protein kinase [Nocardiopsis potens]